MALDVQYGAIRSEVISNLNLQKCDMEDLLAKLDGLVDSLPNYMEGDTLNAYNEEYHTIVQSIYTKLNENLGKYAEQLEAVCQEFEQLDSEMNLQLS